MEPQARMTTPREADLLARGLDSFSKAYFGMDPREDIVGALCDVTVVYKESGDVIFQLFPHGSLPCRPEEERQLLAEMLDVYFGDVARFSASYVPEMKSWAIRATGLQQAPNYSKEHYSYQFVSYINQALAQMRKQ